MSIHPHALMSAFARVLMCGLALLSDASAASLCWLILLTVCVETVGSRLCSTYISFVSSQGVSEPINSIIFSCALLACETDPATCIPQLRQKLTNDCAHTMKRHGAFFSNVQDVSLVSINPHALMSAFAHVLMCGLALLSADKSTPFSYARN